MHMTPRMVPRLNHSRTVYVLRRCTGKIWRPLDNDDNDDEDRINDRDSSDIDDNNRLNATTTGIPPKIPAITSIRDAIQQVESGLVEKVQQTYRGTRHWKKLKKLYSERTVHFLYIFIFISIPSFFFYINNNTDDYNFILKDFI